MSNVKYSSGNFTVATQIGAMRHESPLLPFSNEVILFNQDVVQRAEYFEALDYNTISPDILGATAYLINESPREDFNGNRLKWTRTWARIPTTYDLPGGVYQFQFPAFDAGRDAIVLPVALTIHREFFLCGNHGAYSQWQDIPINRGFFIYESDDITSKTDTVSDISTPSLSDYLAWVNSGTPIQIEDSKITPMFGSVFVREDLFVTAQ